jgi:hypothetical protein
MKPGLNSTEFWVSVGPVLAGLVESMKGDREMGLYLMIMGSALAFTYIISRTILKAKEITHGIKTNKVNKEESGNLGPSE